MEGLDPASRAQWEFPASWVGVDNVRSQSLFDRHQRTYRISGIVALCWAVMRDELRVRDNCQFECNRLFCACVGCAAPSSGAVRLG